VEMEVTEQLNPGSTSASGQPAISCSELLDSTRRQWQELPNWTSATVGGLTWEGTAEENAQKYISLVGVSSE